MPFETPGDKPTETSAQSDQQTASKQPPEPSTSQGHSAFLIVGDRAFHTEEDVTNKIQHADSHIATLEQERAADREKLSTVEAENARLKSIVEALENPTHSGNTDQTDQLSNEELIARTVDGTISAINQRTTAAQQEKNLAECENKAKEVYGDSYQAKVAELATGLGMTVDQVNKLGRESVAAFNRLFLPDTGQQQAPGVTHSTETGIQPGVASQAQQQSKPVNIMKMRREKDRIRAVSEMMQQAGVNN